MTSPQQHLQPESLAAQREGLRELGVLFLATLLAGLLLYVLFHGKFTRFDEIGLGEDTSAVFATVDGAPIHCGDLTTVEACLAGFRRRGNSAAALWLGNSQLHGVNQYLPGQETASARLFARLRPQGLDLVTLSQPNANLQEHLVLYSYLSSRLPLRGLLLPAVFDDVRETGIRDTLASALEDPATRVLLEGSEVGRGILSRTKPVSDPDLAALDQTAQEHSEKLLNAWLGRYVELWELRPEARGRISNWIYGARNLAFGITASSKRRLIEGRYLENLAAAETLLADAEKHGIRVLLYLPPIRGEVELPYVTSEYERFRRDIEGLAARHGAVFLDLGDAVPAALFGFMKSDTPGVEREPDFMHFQAGGHAILADRLAEALKGWSPGSAP